MTDSVWTRAEIESPCIKVCLIHPDTDLCVGCHRTKEEIGTWSGMSADERRRIMDTLPDRAGMARPKRRGGRAAKTDKK